MSHPLSRRGLLGGLFAAAASLIMPSPQPAAPPAAAAPPPPALPPPEALSCSTCTYDYDGNLVSIDDGQTPRLTYTTIPLPTVQPLEPPRAGPSV